MHYLLKIVNKNFKKGEKNQRVTLFLICVFILYIHETWSSTTAGVYFVCFTDSKQKD